MMRKMIGRRSRFPVWRIVAKSHVICSLEIAALGG
jgi:hypothetical protein